MKIDKSKLKGFNNHPMTQSLFYEFYSPEDKPPVYTLKDEDRDGLPSLYRLYMEMEDLTEFEFANTYLCGFKHWKTLCSLKWFKPYVTRWREELQEKIRARSLKILLEKALEDGRDVVKINQYLVGKGYLDKDTVPLKDKRGRPLKDRTPSPEIELSRSRDTNNDLKRLEELRAPGKTKEALQ